MILLLAGLYGAIWGYMGLYGAIWSYMELYGAIYRNGDITLGGIEVVEKFLKSLFGPSTVQPA